MGTPSVFDNPQPGLTIVSIFLSHPNMEQAREKFSPDELTECLKHYDIGQPVGTQEFNRGSKRSPKLIIITGKGKFLLKRRVPGRDDLAKIRFTHDIQRVLIRHGFPLPRIIASTDEGKTLLILKDRCYELFEFVSGEDFDGSLDASYHAGAALGLYHRLLANFRTEYSPPTGSYHNASTIRQAIRRIICTLPLESRPPQNEVTRLVESLEGSYAHCCGRTADLGLEDWPTQIVHGDWHPGNMLFRQRKVLAVVDYDAARLQQRVIDLANGVLQFSIITGGESPKTWPDHLDESRFKRFMRGYATEEAVSHAEIQAVPYLMCEAIIAEGVLPVAATGTFGRFEGYEFLEMVDRKVRWILSHLEEIYAVSNS